MRHELVRALVAHFAEAAGIVRPVRVFTRPGVFERHLAHRGGMTRGDRAHLRKGWALSYGQFRRPLFFFNLGRHGKLGDLADSAAHEVVHIRWPSLQHGSLFAKRVRALLDGYRCGAKGKRLPEAFR